MKGNFKSVDTKSCIFISILFFGVFPCFCLFAKNDAAIIAISVLPMIVGILPLIRAMNLPCSYSADEKSLTIKAGRTERRYTYGEIRDISCKYDDGGSGVTLARLTITELNGETHTYREVFKANMTDLLNDPDNAKRPQLFQLCDYVNRAKGAA